MLPLRISKTREALFKLFCWVYPRDSRRKVMNCSLALIEIAIAQSQLLSLTIFAASKINHDSSKAYLLNIFLFSRIDIQMIVNNYQIKFTVMLIALLTTNLALNMIIFSQILLKKYFLKSKLIFIIKISAWLLTSVFELPIILYTTTCFLSLLKFHLNTSDYHTYYSDLPNSILVPLLVLAIAFYPMTFLTKLFSNQPMYSQSSPSTAHSALKVQEFLFLPLISFIKIALSWQTFNFIYLLIAAYNAHCYFYHLPYFSMPLNKAKIQCWASVALLCVLIIVAQALQNFDLIELNFIVLWMFGCLLCSYLVDKRVKYLQNRQLVDNPFLHELKIRFNLFSIRGNVEAITQNAFEHFEQSNKAFKNFSQQNVWESLIIKDYVKDTELSLLKLTKINTSQSIGHEILEHRANSADFLYRYPLESQYLLYTLFNYSAKEIISSDKNLILVKHLNTVLSFIELDREISHKLLELVELLARKSAARFIEKKINNISNLMIEYEIKYEVILKKLGNEEISYRLFQSLRSEILENLDIHADPSSPYSSTPEFVHIKTIGNDIPLIIISGWVFNAGTILYTNFSFKSLLKINASKQLIGTNFNELAFGPIKENYGKMFLEFVSRSQSAEDSSLTLLLIDSNRNPIEVSMNMKLGYYSYSPCIIASFVHINKFTGLTSNLKGIELCEKLESSSAFDQQSLDDNNLKQNAKSLNSAYSNRIHNLLVSKSQTAKTILKISIIASFITFFLLLLAIIIVISKLILSFTANEIISEVGLMRYLSCSILSNVYSLDLMKNNYTLQFSEGFYRSTIHNNSARLENLLEKYRVTALPLAENKFSFFDDAYIEFAIIDNNDYKYSKIRLSDGIKVILHTANIINNTPFEDFGLINDQILLLYSNIPTSYIEVLNQSVVDISSSYEQSLDILDQWLSTIELCFLLPFIALLFISLVCFYSIESINSTYWKNFTDLSDNSMTSLCTSMVKRLKTLHGISFFPNMLYLKNKNSKIKNYITLKAIIKILVLLAISVAFYFILKTGSQSVLLRIWKFKVIHTNFGGMRRMLAPLSLFWARNAILESSNLPSYINFISDYKISSSVDKMQKTKANYLFVQKLLMDNLFEYPQNQFNLKDYNKLMFGNACEIVQNLNKCTQSIVAQGLDSGLKEYFKEIERSQARAKIEGFAAEDFILIEKLSKVVENSFIYGLNVYSTTIDVIIEGLKEKIYNVISLFSCIIFFWYIIFIWNIPTQLIKNIENKRKVLSMFSKQIKI